MAVWAPLYATYWGMLSQPDKQKLTCSGMLLYIMDGFLRYPEQFTLGFDPHADQQYRGGTG